MLEFTKGDCAVDVTAGGGGHLRAIAEAVGPTGAVIALDRDERAHGVDAAGGVQQAFSSTTQLFHRPFSMLKDTLVELGIEGVDGLLCGFGSFFCLSLTKRTEVFPLKKDGPLDMRMDQSKGQTAYELLAESSAHEIADIIFQYGEEPRSRRIARAIKDSWPLPNSTLHFADLVRRASGYRNSRFILATRTFQALRIAVNNELRELETLLAVLPEVLNPGGRAAIISFHSLEDRMVKRAFRECAKGKEAIWSLQTKKPIVPSEQEIQRNPRARSSKLRAITVNKNKRGLTRECQNQNRILFKTYGLLRGDEYN